MGKGNAEKSGRKSGRSEDLIFSIAGQEKKGLAY